MLEMGTQVGPYKILSQIGAGGMGVVYRARDVRLDRDVALKVLIDKNAKDPEAVQRFEKEAKAIAALSHPNILAIHDFDRDGDLYYVITEYLEGDTLRNHMQTLSWRKAAEYGIEIAKGLAAAHSKGVVHRDLKPENIFIMRDGTVKILDFGLAQIRPEQNRSTLETAASNESLDTQETVLGTIGYISPEQIRALPVDGRTDLFSLGCIFYEMLTGRRPFLGETVYETVSNVLREDPPEIADTGKKIPLEFQRLIRHCLEKNPNERFQSAQDVAYNLKNILSISETGSNAGIPVQSPVFNAKRAWIGIILALLGTSIAILYFQNANFERVRTLAVISFSNLTQNPDLDYLGEGISESIVFRLSQIPSLKVIAQNSGDSTSRDVSRIEKDLKVDAILTGGISQENGSVVVRVSLINSHDHSEVWREQYVRKNENLLTLQNDISREIVDALDLKLSGEQQKKLQQPTAANNEAYRSYLKGRYYWNRRSAGGLNQAKHFFQEAIDKDPLYALAYAGLADCYAMMGSYDLVEPTDAYSRARAAAQKALEIDENLAEAHTSLGHIDMYYWDWDNAERQFRRAIDLKPNYAVAHQWFANYLAIMGRNGEAVDEVKEASDLDPLSLSIAVGVGRQYYLAKHFDHAIEYFKKALDLDDRYAPAYSALGQAYVQKGNLNEGIASHKKAIELSNENPDYVAMLAYAYAVSGKTEEANRLLEKLKNRSDYVSPVYTAMVYVALKKPDDVFASLNQAYAEHSEYLSFVKVEPEFEPIRNDQRYKTLMGKIGL